jgi:chromosomal replication initiator protein
MFFDVDNLLIIELLKKLYLKKNNDVIQLSYRRYVSGVMILVSTDIWSNFLSILSKKMTPITYNTWFKPCVLYELDQKNGKIIIQVPMTIHKKMLETTWYDLIVSTLNEITGVNYDAKFILEQDVNNKNINDDNKIDIVNNNEVINSNFETNLKKELTFDNFVVGDTNKFAKTAALAVAQQPGKIYNPLFIYGKSGLGKTHLMHAIGNYITDNTNLRVLYTTSDMFRDDYTNISSSNNKEDTFNKANQFKNKYRDVDVLLIDDIQFLVGAEMTQQEFFHTFEELHSHNKQIIISSDRSPDDLKLLEERLRSRFAWGLPVDIWPPDFDLRCRIIKDKIKHLTIADQISDEIIEYMANACDTDVRSLEGIINRLVAYTAMYVPDKIDLDFAREALGDFITKNIYSTNDISMVQKAVADYYGLTVDVLKGKKKSKNIAYPRMLAMYLARMLTDESFPRIGLEFGARDHSTVMHACDKITDDLKDNKKLQDIINEIKAKI